MTRVSFLCLTAVAAVFLSSPIGVEAQSDGCPWCTTPTTCAEVDENTDIGGCYNIGAGCEEISGSCTVSPLPPGGGFAAHESEWRELLEGNGLEYTGFEIAALDTGEHDVVGVGQGLYVKWACTGAPLLILRKTKDGSWTRIDSPEIAARVHLASTVGD